jgi:DNA-binding Lrp family transcriptional regulator
MPLDRIDAEIVVALQNDARRSNKELAAHVGLAPSSCLERVRRLQATGVLRGFHAEVDPAAVGVRLEAMIVIRLDRHGGDVVEAFRRDLLAREEVVAVYHLAGVNDFLVHVAVRDAEQLRTLAVDAVSSRPEVRDVETSLVFERWRGGGMPVYARQETPPPRGGRRGRGPRRGGRNRLRR